MAAVLALNLAALGCEGGKMVRFDPTGQEVKVIEVTGELSLRQWGSRIAAREKVTSIGVLVGDDSEVFGKVTGGVIDRERHVWILDERFFNVRLFRGDTHVATFGRLGFGPGEFRFPHAVVPVGADSVAVLDLTRAVMVVLDADSLVGIPRHEVPPGLETGCSLADGSIVERVLSLEGDDLILVRDRRTGDELPVVSARHHDSPLAQLAVNQGPLGCGVATIIIAFNLSGDVEEWTRSGKLLWRGRVPDYHPVVLDVGERRVSQHAPIGAKEVHRIVAVASLSRGVALVQMEVRRARGDGDTVIRSFLASGGGEWMPLDLHERVLDIRRNQMLVTSDANGYPQVRLYDLGH